MDSGRLTEGLDRLTCGGMGAYPEHCIPQVVKGGGCVDVFYPLNFHPNSKSLLAALDPQVDELSHFAPLRLSVLRTRRELAHICFLQKEFSVVEKQPHARPVWCVLIGKKGAC